MSEAALLQVSNLCKSFPIRAGGFGSRGKRLRAVHNVSFSLEPGQTLGLVGESGCGKSTTGRLVLKLIEPDSGSIKLRGTEFASMHDSQLKELRREVQIVFQDPLGSLNPRLSARQIITEPLVVQRVAPAQREQRLAELLSEVELPRDTVNRYPHEFSGGQRQRLAIARALSLRPALIVADEPVSALDASIQSQILMLLRKLQEEHGLAYLFISHDLAVVRFISHFVAVMYLGEIVECGPVEAVYQTPRHPYTQALLAAIPKPEPRTNGVQPLEGLLPSAIDPPTGCSFASRCSHADIRCLASSPPPFNVGEQHVARCWLNENNNAASK